MSTIEKLIKKSYENYKLIESGKRSISKGRVLNDTADVIIKLKLIQLKLESKDKE